MDGLQRAWTFLTLIPLVPSLGTARTLYHRRGIFNPGTQSQKILVPRIIFLINNPISLRISKIIK